MNNLAFIIKSLPFFVTINVAVGLILHDTHLDKLAASASDLPIIHFSKDKKKEPELKLSSAHTHVEQVSLSQATYGLKTSDPLARPRGNDRKYRLQNRLRTQRDGSDYVWPSI